MAKKSVTPVVEAKEQTKRRGRPPGVNAAKKPEPKPSEYQSFYDAFAAKLRELMEERHESQNSLGQTIAEMTNCKGSMQSVVHRWFHAKGMPKWEDAFALKKLFGVTFDYLFDPEVTERHRLTDDERNLLTLARRVGFEVAEARILMIGEPAKGEAPAMPFVRAKTGAKAKTS